MEILEILKKKRFIITAELGPPKGTRLDHFLKQAAFLRGRVDGVNVTDQQAGIMKLGSLACCRVLKDFGIEPIMQITCRDKNRIALQSEILSAYVMKIQNVLVLTGDPIAIGDHPQAKSVFDLDVAELIAAIKKLENGSDMTDHKLDGAPAFSIGAALNPCVDDLDIEISKTRKKIENGAEFFQTQGIFDVSRFNRFIERYHKENFKIPILAGIILIKSAKMANFMNEKIPGINIPHEIVSRFEKTRDVKVESIAVACETIQLLRPHIQGIHLMAIGWEELIPDILSRISVD